jgi:hypothetical protein
LALQSGYTLKLAQIRRQDHGFLASGMAGDEQIQRADGLSGSFKQGADLSVVPGSLLVEGCDLEEFEEAGQASAIPSWINRLVYPSP